MQGLCKDAECVNTRGSFRCTCKPGSMLDPSRSHCICKCCREPLSLGRDLSRTPWLRGSYSGLHISFECTQVGLFCTCVQTGSQSCIITLHGHCMVPAEAEGNVHMVWQQRTQTPGMRELPRELDFLGDDTVGGKAQWLMVRGCSEEKTGQPLGGTDRERAKGEN